VNVNSLVRQPDDVKKVGFKYLSLPNQSPEVMSRIDRGRGKIATLHEVAARAGVSHQTVSRVVNDSPRVAEQTRARVLRAVEELDYKPNKAARNLVSKRSTLIGVITFATHFYGPAHILTSIDQAARNFGYKILLASLLNPSPERIDAAARELIAHGVEGMIVNVPIELDPIKIHPSFRGVPTVIMDANGKNRIATVTLDNEAGTRMATQHLVQLGHTKIACVSGILRWRCGRLRQQEWRRTLHELGLASGPTVEGDWSAEGGYRATKELLESGRDQFTAIVASNDQLALGALRALHEAGLEVPRDVSIVGFDNIPEAAFFYPPLTTIDHAFDAVSRHSLEYLIEIIRDPTTLPKHRNIVPTLVCRESTDRLQRRGRNQQSRRER
jgi:DNA-binding LacI/PurR family transcriptional regulator